MLEPERKNFSVWRGTTFRVPISLWQNAAMTIVYNLASYTGALVIREKRGGTQLGVIDVNITPPNLIELHATNTTTDLWAFDQGVYELKLISGGGDVDILFYGIITVKDHA